VSSSRAILDFWFGDDTSSVQARGRRWFSSDPEFDRLCTERFLADHEAAAAGALNSWENDPRGCVALILLLDQCPCNMFRNTPRAFATDAQARDLTRHAIAARLDRKMPAIWRAFVHMPLQHSESLADQNESVRLTRELVQEHPDCAGFLKFAEAHRETTRRFGRFPHRNSILGRTSSPAEAEFLGDNSSTL